jgi:hypothetical protein
LCMVTDERPSPDSAPISKQEEQSAKQAAEQFLRSIRTFTSDIPPQKGSREERQYLDARFAGDVQLNLATRNRAVLTIHGVAREFFEHEGTLVLASRERRLPDALFRYALLRAEEAIAAVRRGHAEARKASVGKSSTLRQLKLNV